MEVRIFSRGDSTGGVDCSTQLWLVEHECGREGVVVGGGCLRCCEAYRSIESKTNGKAMVRFERETDLKIEDDKK